MCGFEEVTQSPEPMELRAIHEETSTPHDKYDRFYYEMNDAESAILGGEWKVDGCVIIYCEQIPVSDMSMLCHLFHVYTPYMATFPRFGIWFCAISILYFCTLHVSLSESVHIIMSFIFISLWMCSASVGPNYGIGWERWSKYFNCHSLLIPLWQMICIISLWGLWGFFHHFYCTDLCPAWDFLLISSVCTWGIMLYMYCCIHRLVSFYVMLYCNNYSIFCKAPHQCLPQSFIFCSIPISQFWASDIQFAIPSTCVSKHTKFKVIIINQSRVSWIIQGMNSFT